MVFFYEGNIMRLFKQHGYNLQSQKLKIYSTKWVIIYFLSRLFKLNSFSKNPKFIFNKYKYEELDIDDQNDLNYAKANLKYGIKNFKFGKN